MLKLKNSTKKETNLSARCERSVKERLKILSKTEQVSKGEMMSKCITIYYDRKFPNSDLLNNEEKFFGRYGSDKKDLSVNTKKYMKEIMRAKYSGD